MQPDAWMCVEAPGLVNPFAATVRICSSLGSSIRSSWRRLVLMRRAISDIEICRAFGLGQLPRDDALDRRCVNFLLHASFFRKSSNGQRGFGFDFRTLISRYVLGKRPRVPTRAIIASMPSALIASMIPAIYISRFETRFGARRWSAGLSDLASALRGVTRSNWKMPVFAE